MPTCLANFMTHLGTLEGFSFDSDDEANKNAKTASKPTDQSGGAEEVTNTNGKAKAKVENVCWQNSEFLL